MADEQPTSSSRMSQGAVSPVQTPGVNTEMSQALMPRGPQTEKCLIGNQEISLPLSLVEDYGVFSEILSQNTWQKVLTDSQRRHLLKFLPTFSQNDVLEKQQTLRQLFSGQNFKFGNPLKLFHNLLKEGMFSPDIAKYAALYKKTKLKEYRHQQQVYYTSLLNEILINRHKILSQVHKTPMDEPLKLDMIKYEPPAKENSIQHKVNRRYIKIMQEVNKECGIDGTSSSDEDIPSVPTKSRKQLFKPTLPDSPTEGPSSGILPTLAVKSQFVNGDVTGTQAPGQCQIEITDEDIRALMRKHRKRRLDGEQAPDLDTRSLTLQEIILRTQPPKKLAVKKELGNFVEAGKRKMKEKGERKKKMKLKDMESQSVALAPCLLDRVPPVGEMLPDDTAQDGSRMEVETEEAVASLTEPIKSENVVSCGLPEHYQIPQAVQQTVPPSTPVIAASLPPTAIATPSGGQHGPSNFFSLLRNFICEENEEKTSTMKLEEKVREWQENPTSHVIDWFNLQQDWVELVSAALKFLSGDVLGLSIDNFIPFLDYKERAQHWKWIGGGRDSDENMMALFKHWLENKDEATMEARDRNSASPPPPKIRTNFIVRATTDGEKEQFREQEEERFYNPHKSYTYSLHGYESVVGPVKGVYSKESAMNKARDHALLIKDRPAYVTILTLVRDAAARLPNGEGTRSDICELLKDSQFLAPGVTDAQINTVVSGALDRLHYEKDPCVKYDVNRKVWIYLHRNRSEEEFEMIHQAQGKAAKAKKALAKPKPSKKIKETVHAAQTSPKAALLNISSGSDANLEPTSVPSSVPASPRTPVQTVSPRTPQVSPRASTTPQMSPRGSPKVAAALAAQVQVGPRTPAGATLVQFQGSPKVGTTSVTHTGSPKPSVVQVGPGQGKPVSVTFLQPQAAARLANPSTATVLQNSQSSPRPVLATGAKPLSFNLIQAQQAGAKVVDGIQSQPTRTVMITQANNSGQRLVNISSSEQIQSQVGTVSVSQAQSVMAAQLQRQVSTGAVSVLDASGKAKTVTTLASSVAKLSQQLSAPQVVNVTKLAAAQQKQVAAASVQGATTFKIQGGSILQSQDGKPITIQRAQSMDSSVTPHQALALQRVHSVSSDATPEAVVTKQLTLGRGGKPTSIIRAGNPTTIAQSSKPAGIGRGGKPTTLLITRPTTAPTSGKPSSISAASLPPNIAQIIQSSSLGGKPIQLGGKPFIIGGKPIQFGGKPIQIGGKPIQLIQSKPGQIGLIQGQGGFVTVVTQATTAGSVSSTAQQSSGTVVTPTLVSQILQSGATTIVHQQPGKPAPVAPPASQGVQTPSKPAMSQGTSLVSQATKLLTTAQTQQLLGTQILVQPTQTSARMVHPQLLSATGGRPTYITTQGGKPGHNIQLVKTVLSQPGGKPAQSTYVLAQPRAQSVVTTVATSELSQATIKNVQGAGKSKAGPVYARIITPPPGIRLTTVRPGQVTAAHVSTMQGMSVIQALPSEAAQILSQLPVGSVPVQAAKPANTQQQKQE